MQSPSTVLSTGHAVYTMGQGEPLIVICGGPGLSSRIYQKYLVPLASQYQLIFWDYAGTGASSPRAENSTEADYRDFVSVVDQLEIPRVNILAHSYGGLAALRYAVEHPKRLAKLVLAGTAAHFGPVFAEILERKKAKLSPADFEVYMSAVQQLASGSLTEKSVSDFLRMEIKFQSYRALSPEEEEQSVQESEFSLPVFFSNRDWLTVDLTPRLKEIQAPTLVMTSKYDAPVPPQYSKPLAAIPNVKFFEFEDSGHWPFSDEPELFRREMENFLSR